MFSSKGREKDMPLQPYPSRVGRQGGKRPQRLGSLDHQRRPRGQRHADLLRRHPDRRPRRRRCAQLGPGHRRQGLHPRRYHGRRCHRPRQVQGSIRARKVLLCATSHVEGNILHEAFSVEAGAFFEGNCRHSDNPLADEAAKKAPEYRRQPRRLPSRRLRPLSTHTAAPVSSPVSSMVSRPMTSSGAAAATFTPLKSN